MHSELTGLFFLPQLKITAILTGMVSLLIFSNNTQAQTIPADASTPSTSDGLTPSQLDNLSGSSRQYSRPGFSIEPNSGSQRFFDQGREDIYFLPEESEDNELLNLDESIEAEGIKYEDFYNGIDVDR